jgi:hypothetical protein
MQKASRAFEEAIKRDCAWFHSNPAMASLRRKVAGPELPRQLRGLGIAEVVIERAGPDRFVRTFFDHAGRAVLGSMDLLKDTAVPGAWDHTIRLSDRAVSVDRANRAGMDPKEDSNKNGAVCRPPQTPLRPDLSKWQPAPGDPGIIPGGIRDRALRAVLESHVTSADREYFERNPESTEYERDALPVELEQAWSSLGFTPRGGRVLVRQLAPGVRVRELLGTSK